MKIAISVIFITYLFIINLLPVFKPEFIRPYGDEDGIVESMGATFFFLASVIFTLTYFRMTKYAHSGFKKTEALWILGLALLFFVACGEEISWGQRIFDFSTPEAIKEINAQHEFNLHNLQPFQGEHKTGLAAMVSSHRLFYLFLIGYIVVIPLLMQLNSWPSRLINKMKVPIAPIWIGYIFFLVAFLTKVTQFLFARNNDQLYHALVEMMETNIGVVVLLLSLVFYQSKSLPKKVLPLVKD